MGNYEIDENKVQKAYMILKLFFETKDAEQDLVERLHSWLISEVNAQEKDIALERIFCEMMEPDNAYQIDIDEWCEPSSGYMRMENLETEH